MHATMTYRTLYTIYCTQLYAFSHCLAWHCVAFHDSELRFIPSNCIPFNDLHHMYPHVLYMI